MTSKKEMLKAAAAESEGKKTAADFAIKREAANKKSAKAERQKIDKKQESVELKGISFRLPVSTIEKLKDLSNLAGLTATGWIASAIETAYELRAADVATMKKLQAK